MINFENRKILSLKIEELESHRNRKICYICGQKFDYEKKNFQKLKEK